MLLESEDPLVTALEVMCATGLGPVDGMAILASQVGFDEIADMWERWVESGGDFLEGLAAWKDVDPELAERAAIHGGLGEWSTGIIVDGFWTDPEVPCGAKRFDWAGMDAFREFTRSAPKAAAGIAERLASLYLAGGADASVRTDDGAHILIVDIGPWLTTASPKAIAEAMSIGWGGDYAADAIVYDLIGKGNHRLATLIGHCEDRTAAGWKCGFECHVNADQAEYWIAVNRPALIPLIGADPEDMPGILAAIEAN
jgi:hypothetical protein